MYNQVERHINNFRVGIRIAGALLVGGGVAAEGYAIYNTINYHPVRAWQQVQETVDQTLPPIDSETRKRAGEVIVDFNLKRARIGNTTEDNVLPPEVAEAFEIHAHEEERNNLFYKELGETDFHEALAQKGLIFLGGLLGWTTGATLLSRTNQPTNNTPLSNNRSQQML